MAAFMVVLATPITRLVFDAGQFNPRSPNWSRSRCSVAFSLPFGGLNLPLT
jgi:peptidoglycan biosynthesis protein MviN/MurJ (putative lipid II flippase)